MIIKELNFKQKKGDVFQLTFLLIILLIIAIIGLLFGTLALKFSSAYNDMGLINATDDSVPAKTNEIIKGSTPNTTDMIVFMLFLGGTIGIVLSATKTNFSPIIMFLFILLLFIDVFVASGFVNIYSGFREAEVLSEYSGTQVLTNMLFSKYTPLIFWIIGLLVLIIMYGKSGSDIVQ